MDPIEQSAQDRSEIKIKLIENGVLVKSGPAWFTFPTWEGKGGAAEHIGFRIEKIKKERTGVPKGGC